MALTLPRTAKLDSVVERIEPLTALDPVADKVAAVVTRLIPNGPWKDALSGTWLGHPLHPVLVSVPVGGWVGASVLDLVGGRGGRRAARTLVGFGVLTALPTAAAGWSDWAETSGAERRVGLVHAGANIVSVSLYSASWLARRRGKYLRGALLALAGSTTVGLSGYLGGHLAYAYGVGVDTTAFQAGPDTWTDVAAEGDVVEGTPLGVDADGVPILLARHAGRIHALADRCTHRGAPLHEGDLVGGCIRCPWHASEFRLEDGAVERGPATRPQPAYEVQVTGGRVEIRRSENQALRTNTAGAG